MRIAAALTIALGVAAALAQTGSPQARTARGAADAGTKRARKDGPVYLGTDPPGRLRPEPADAGIAQAVDAGPTPLQLEVQQLRARVDALERERSQAQQQQSQQLDEITRQLQQLRGELADTDSRRQASEQQQVARRQALDSGVSALHQAQDLLAGGNASVENQLSQAEASFPQEARRNIAYAREALRNGDLSAARSYLSTAIVDAQQGR